VALGPTGISQGIYGSWHKAGSCTLIAHWSLYVPPGLTFNNSTFCPHSVVMCFVWISEQTANISLYNINWLVCITETECVYCAVRAECLYTISLNFSFVLLWVRQSFTGLSPERPAFDPWLSHVEFVVGKVALEHVFLREFRFFLPVWCHRPSMVIFIYMLLSPKDKQTKLAFPEQETVG
jgi:hypothetical protein